MPTIRDRINLGRQINAQARGFRVMLRNGNAVLNPEQVARLRELALGQNFNVGDEVENLGDIQEGLGDDFEGFIDGLGFGDIVELLALA